MDPSAAKKKWFSFPSENQSQTPVLLHTYWTHKTTGQVEHFARARRPRRWFWSRHSGFLLRGGHNNLSLTSNQIQFWSFRPKLHQHRIIFMGAESYVLDLGLSKASREAPPHSQTIFPFKQNILTNFLHSMEQVFHSAIYWEADFVPDPIWVTCISLSKLCLTDKNA